MKEVCKLTDIVKEMEARLNIEIDGAERDDAEKVDNSTTQKEQSCDTETEERRLRGGKVTGVKEQEIEKTGGQRKSVRQRKRKRVSGDRSTGSQTVENEERRDSDTGGEEVDTTEAVGKTVRQKTDGRRQSVQQKTENMTGVKVTGERVTVVKEVAGEKGQVRREENVMGGKMKGRKEVRVNVLEEKMTGGNGTRENATGKKGMEENVTGEKTARGKDNNQTYANRRSYSEAVIEGARRKERVFMGDSILRKTDKTICEGKDVVVCLPGARIEHVTERVEKVLGYGKGGSILVHVGTNNADKEGTTGIVQKYRHLVRKLKKTRVEQVILSGILPVMGGRGARYRNCKRMAINALVEQMCEEEGVGFIDLWGYFVGREDMYMRDGLHLSGKGAAVFSENLLRSVDSGTGCIYLN